MEVVRQEVRYVIAVRRRDAATLPSETLPVRMMGTKVKGQRGANQGTTLQASVHTRVHFKAKKESATLSGIAQWKQVCTGI